MLRHSRLGARSGVPPVALVPPFFAFSIAATPDPSVVDLGPVVGMYLLAVSVRFVRLGAAARNQRPTHPARRGGGPTPTIRVVSP